MEIFRILLRTFIGYFILVAMLKIMGKREIGQLSLFDLIIFLSIADIMVIGIENYELNYLYVILPIILVTLLQKVIAFLILKFTKLRKLFDGKESIIIYKGNINIKEMKKLCYNFDDLVIQLRQKDIKSIMEVEYAILENNGKLSVFKYNDTNVFPIPIIITGKVEKEYLKLLGIDMKWIEKEVKKQNYLLEEINCAYYQDNKLIIVDSYFFRIMLLF